MVRKGKTLYLIYSSVKILENAMQHCVLQFMDKYITHSQDSSRWIQKLYTVITENFNDANEKPTHLGPFNIH